MAAALEPYLDGARAGDADRIQDAFFDHAMMAGTVGGNFSRVGIDAFAQFGLVPAPELRAQIVWIDVSGPVASVKVEFIDWTGMRYTDYLLLAEVDGAWKISAKLFNAHSATKAAD